MFYSYGDKATLEHMIRESVPPESLPLQLDHLHQMVQYCQNEVECRRVIILGHFGETFTKERCRNTCDNCR